MFAAARFIALICANQNDRVVIVSRVTVDEALGAAGRFSTNDADCAQFGDFFGHAEQLRQRAKWFAPKVEVKTSGDNTNVPVCKLFDDFDDAVVKELDFIDGDHRCLGEN